MATYEEVVQDRKKYLERKAERFNTFSIHAKESAENHMNKSDQAVSGIPMGQPILIGHHSQRRHEKALERSHAHAFKALDEDKRAEKWKNRSENAKNLLDKMESSKPYMLHKINDAEKDIRLWERRIEKSGIFIRLYDAGKLTDLISSACGFSPSAIESARNDNERGKRELAQAQEKLEFWKKKLDSIGGLFDVSTLKKGDIIHTTYGNFPVVRINKKTITVSDWLKCGPTSKFNIPFSIILGKVESEKVVMPGYVSPTQYAYGVIPNV